MSSCIDQQQVAEESNPAKENALQRWARKSVWSLVCAMELGLISSENKANGTEDESFVKTNVHAVAAVAAVAAVPTNTFLSINSPIDVADSSPRKPPPPPPLRISARISNRGRRKSASTSTSSADTTKRNVHGSRRNRKLDRANNSTMENFWKSCKRKARRSDKRQIGKDRRRERNGDFTFDLPRSKTCCPTCKCKCSQDDPSRIARSAARFPARETSLLSTRKPFDRQPLRRNGDAGFVSKSHARKRNARNGPYEPPSMVLPPAKERYRRYSSIDDREQDLYRLSPIDHEYATWLSNASDVSIPQETERYDDIEIELEKPDVQDFPSLEDGMERSSDVLPIEEISNENHAIVEKEETPSSDPEKNEIPEPTENVRKKKLDRPRDGSTEEIVKRNERRSRSLKKNRTSVANANASANTSASDSEIAKNIAKRETLRLAITSLKDGDYRETRRVTRGSTKVGKDNFVGKLVWGCCSGWWPAIIIDADHVGMLSETGKLWVYWIGEARISLLNEKTQIESFSSNLKCRLMQNSNVGRVRAIDATMQMLRKRLGCALTKPYATWIEKNFSEMVEAFDEIKFYPYPPGIQQRLDHLKEKNAKVTEKYLMDLKREAEGKKTIEKSKESSQRVDVDVTRLPLKEQHPGVITWAKIAGHNWWPAMIIDYRDCCMREPAFGCQWIMWYGDYKLSEVHHQLFLRFDKGIVKLQEYIRNTKKHPYLVGVLQAAKDYCSRLELETENWTLADVFEYFLKTEQTEQTEQTLCSPPRKGDSVKIYDKYSTHIVGKLNELKNNANVDDKRAEDIKNSDDLRSAISGRVSLESVCLKCLKVVQGVKELHPFFEGSLCKECSEQYKPCMFVFGNDSKCFYCTVCAATGTVIICDREDCPRVYCTACMKHLLCPTTYEQVLQEDPWECFLCSGESRSISDTVVRPRSNWKDKIISMFRTNCDSNVRPITRSQEKRKIRVLSLFDGLSTGLLVLLKLGLAVDVYYASEIDPDALLVSATHYGDRIIHLGDVRDINKEKIKEIAPIDLLIGGSPCNDLSLANPARLGLYDPKGTGILFFEYRRILNLLKKLNNGRHLFWMFENVASMPSEYRLEINKHLGQEPDAIDSADFSPQHRLRLYWHNLPIEPHSLANQGEQDVQDILTPNCQRYALVKKIRTVTTKVNSLKQGKLALKPILMKDESDSLWITELEEIFGFPRHYTDVKNLSATKRQRLIGKSWSVQTLTAILSSLCPYFQCNTVKTE